MIFTMEYKGDGLERIRAIADELPVIAISALKKTAQQCRTQVKRAITEEYNIRSSVIKDEIKLVEHPSDLSIELRLHSQRLPIDMFLTGRSAQPMVEIKKGRRIPLLGRIGEKRGAFVTGVTKGHAGISHLGIFERSKNTSRWTKGRPQTSSPNLAIQEVKTLSPSEMMSSTSVFVKIEKFFQENFERIFNHELEWFMSKGKT